MDRVVELAERQHGLIGREQALAHGMTRGQIDQRLRSGGWERAGRGVYRIPGSVPTWEQRLMAAVMATGAGGAASRQSAAALWRLPGFGPGPIEVTQFRGPSNTEPGARPPRITVPARAPGEGRSRPSRRAARSAPCSTSAGACTRGRAERALDNALAMELTTVQRLGMMLAETGARGRDGTALLRRILAVRTEEYVPPESELEALLDAVLSGAGLPMPTPQARSAGLRRRSAESMSSTGRHGWSSRRTAGAITPPGSTAGRPSPGPAARSGGVPNHPGELAPAHPGAGAVVAAVQGVPPGGRLIWLQLAANATVTAAKTEGGRG